MTIHLSRPTCKAGVKRGDCKTEYCVRFAADHDAVFSESNGEDRPLTEEEYKGSEYYGCPDHPRAGSFCRPFAQGIGYCTICEKRSQPIPYAEYLRYYGNPDRHVYLGCIAEERVLCPCCKQPIERENTDASVWGIDFMDDSPELDAIKLGRNYTPEEVLRLPGYARDIAIEELREVGWQPPKSIRCLTRGCKFLRLVADGSIRGADFTRCMQHQPKPRGAQQP